MHPKSFLMHHESILSLSELLAIHGVIPNVCAVVWLCFQPQEALEHHHSQGHPSP